MVPFFIADKKFIELIPGEKRPKYGFDTIITDDPDMYTDLAVKVEAPYVVVDVDDKQQGLKLIKWLELENITSTIMETDKGYHFWFEDEQQNNVTNFTTACGIVIDIRSHGKNSMVVVKRNNIWRTWISEKVPPLDHIPKWLSPFKFSKEQPDFSKVEKGDRHNFMLSWVTKYKAKGLTPKEIYDMYVFLNTYVMASNVDIRDIELMTINNEFLDMIEVEKEGGKLTTEAMAMQMLEMYEYHIDDSDNLYIWNGTKYEHSYQGYLEREVFRNFSNLSTANRQEVIAKIRLLVMLKLEEYGSKLPLGNHTVVFNNCMLDMDTGDVRPVDNKYFITQVIPHNYEPDLPYDDNVLKVLDKVTLGDSELVTLLLEMVAYSMTSGNYMQKCFMLIGEGSNGKSVIMHMIQQLFKSYSTVPLSAFTNQNALYSMFGKPVNTVDDMGNKMPMNDAFKSIVAGMPVSIKKLYADTISVTINTKLIFGANEMPKTKDKSYGTIRRWVIIPFNAKFTKSDHDYDPYVMDKVSTEQAIQTLINLAVGVYPQLVERKAFTEAEESENELEDFKNDVSNVHQFLQESVEYLNNQDVATCYEDYLNWCSTNGYAYPFSQKELIKQTSLTTEYEFRNARINDEIIMVLRPKKDFTYAEDGFFNESNLRKYEGERGDDVYHAYMQTAEFKVFYLTPRGFRSHIRQNTEFEFRNTTLDGEQTRVLRYKRRLI